jgi:glycosyltransferase involved in cell wall biosynthesis
MRLIVLGPGHPFRGGIARTTTELVRALEARGHATTFLTPLRQYPMWLYPGASDRDPDACPDLGCAHACFEPMNPLSWPACRRIAMAACADAWIVPYWSWVWAGLWLFLLRGNRRPPVLAVVHNPAEHEDRCFKRVVARLVLGRCQALFAHADSLARRVGRQHPGVPLGWHPLAVSSQPPLPHRLEARQTLGLDESTRVALFLGLIRPYKGVDLLIEAAASLPRSWTFIIAGEPWLGLGEDLRRQVTAHGLDHRVRLELRWIPELELARLLAAADVVVLPYRSGSQSAVAPLALGSGLPVLSTRVGGLHEVIEHGVNGWLVEPGSAAALVAGLEALDEGTLQRLAEGAKASRHRLSWDAYAGAVERLLEEIVRSPGSATHSPSTAAGVNTSG